MTRVSDLGLFSPVRCGRIALDQFPEGNMSRRGWRIGTVLSCVLLLALAALSTARPAQAQGSHVDVITVDGIISPVTSRYIEWGIRTAEEDGANCLVILLDTPGGLSSSTEEIVRFILNADVPVVVYVFPRGARAASAGVYITYASHVAAMAPNTHIGAATPVSIGENGDVQQLPPEMQRKIEEDALANLRASAQERGRNPDWAQSAVLEAASATANEAKSLGVVEILADDMNDLLRQLDGRTVTLASGRVVTLQTAGAAVYDRPMSILSRFLMIITDPTVAYLLLGAGLLGLWVEISHPGISLPGVLGGVCIILGLYALGTLSVNWAGVLLMVLAFVLFTVDLFTPTHFVLTTGGVAAFVAGSLLLFNSSTPDLRVEPWAIVVMAATMALLVVLALLLAIARRHKGAVSGREALIGMVGVVRQPLDPTGLILVDGALWRARCEEGEVEMGAQVEVVALDGLLLHVRRRQ
jgi:membrane-bound serine protease (ClpP class)